MKGKQRKAGALLVVFVLCGILFTGCSRMGKEENNMSKDPKEQRAADGEVVRKRAEELEKQVVVTIGDFEMTMDKMMFFLYSVENDGTVKEYYYQAYYEMSFWDSPYDESGATMRDFYKDYVMNSAIQYGVLYQEAVKAGLELSEEEKAENAKFIDDFLDVASAELLERTGFTKEKLTETLEFMGLAEKYYDAMAESFEISEESVAAEIKKEDYKEYSTEYLYLSTSSYDSEYNLIERSEEEKAAYYELMQGYLEQLKQGKPMEEVAEQNTALTYTTKVFLADEETVDPSYRQAAAGLENGSYSEVVKTRYGYYIVRMIDNNCMDSYEAARKELLQAKEDEAFAKAFEELQLSYPQDINEEVWGPLVLGEIAVVPTE